MPESTLRAFRHALDQRSDVLELDLQLTRDGEIVVWHGPRLDNVVIDGVPNSIRERRRMGKRNIFDFNWRELDGRTSVAAAAEVEAAINEKPLRRLLFRLLPVLNPAVSNLDHLRLDDAEVRAVDRRILSLRQFLEFLEKTDPGRAVSLNVELKGERIPVLGRSRFADPGRMGQLVGGLLEDRTRDRRIVVTSSKRRLLVRFRDAAGGRADGRSWFTGVAALEQLPFVVGALLPWRGPRGRLEGRAFQTTYWIAYPRLVRRVHADGGAFHTFLSRLGAWGPLIRRDTPEREVRRRIRKMVLANVDGFMTDRPAAFRRHLDSLDRETGTFTETPGVARNRTG